MNSPATLLTSLVNDSVSHPAYVDRTFGEPLFFTESEIIALKYGSDDTLWTVEEAGLLRHWTSDGQLLERTFLSDLEDLWTFNSDASLVASGANEIALWSTTDGDELARVPCEEWVGSLAFSNDGKYLASGHDDGEIHLWQLPEMTLFATIEAHDGAVSALAFSNDSLQLTSASDDHKIRVWDVATQAAVREWKGHTDRVPAIAWHPKGDFLVSIGWDTTARIWDPKNDDPSMLLNAHSDQVNVVTFSPDGSLLACADSDYAIHIWADPRQGKARFVMQGHGNEIRALAFNANGTRLASAGADRIVHIWDTATGKLVAGPNPSAKHAIAIAGSTLFSTACSSVSAWDRETGNREVTPVAAGDNVESIATSPDGKWLAACGTTLETKLWDLQTKTLSQSLNHTKGPIGSPTFSADSQYLATASCSDGLVWVWKLGQPEAMLVIPEAADNSTLEAISFHPSGKYLAVGGLDWLSTSGGDGALCVWDLEAKDKLATFEAGVTCASFDGAGRYLAAGTYGENGMTVLVWDFSTQEKVFELPGHHDRINAVAFSPDGSWLVSASDDCTLRLWNVLTGRLAVVRQFDAAVQSVRFSDDGKYLFTGNGNTTCYRLELKRLLED